MYFSVRWYLRCDVERSFHDPHADQLLRMADRLRRHFGVEIEGVADQPLAAGRHIFDPGVAGVGAAVEHGDRALHQVQRRAVGQPQPVERMLGLHGGL